MTVSSVESLEDSSLSDDSEFELVQLHEGTEEKNALDSKVAAILQYAQESAVFLLRKQLAAKTRELEDLKQFSAIRHEMTAKVKKQAAKLRYAHATTLDLVVVMDCTRSMEPWIDQAKASMISIVEHVKKDHAGAVVRVGFVAYRDFCDGEKRLEVHALTEDIVSVRNFIQSLRAFGGGDEPEDIAGALEAALALSFQAQAKLLVLVTDSPCHGERFNRGFDDQKYAAQIEKSPDICKLMRRMASGGIDFTFIEIQRHKTASMKAIMKHEYRSVASSKNSKRSFKSVSLSKSSDVVRFASVVRESASSSISRSKTHEVRKHSKEMLEISTINHYGPTGFEASELPSIAEHESSEEASSPRSNVTELKPLDWKEVDGAPEVSAIRHSLHFLPNKEIDWNKVDLKHSQQKTTVRVVPYCFAKGAMRSAHAMFDCKLKKYFVAKFYAGKTGTSTAAEDDVKMQIVAKQLAIQFSISEQVDEAVDFVFSSWYEIDFPTLAGLSASMTVFTAEPYIAGEYKKYNNNNGWVNKEGLTQCNTAQAFSHFSWETTFGQLMVVDIQGVGSIFTDPQIHSLHERAYGHGNLSKAGMTAFFATHECNEVCKALGLRSLKETRKSDATDDPPATHKPNPEAKMMKCSCPLCGEVIEVLRGKFIEKYQKGCEVYCDACTTKVEPRVARKCTLCKKKVKISPYWYLMKGMDPPTTCKLCKVKAAVEAGK